jgi:hypothetical protein
MDPRTVKPLLLKPMTLVVQSPGNVDMRYISDHVSARRTD